MNTPDPNERHEFLTGPIADLMADLGEVCRAGRRPPDGAHERFTMWRDGRSVYVEADLPGDVPVHDADISLLDGKVWVRIRVRDDEAGAPADG